jgi:hypothetical protein
MSSGHSARLWLPIIFRKSYRQAYPSGRAGTRASREPFLVDSSFTIIVTRSKSSQDAQSGSASTVIDEPILVRVLSSLRTSLCRLPYLRTCTLLSQSLLKGSKVRSLGRVASLVKGIARLSLQRRESTTTSKGKQIQGISLTIALPTSNLKSPHDRILFRTDGFLDSRASQHAP